MPENNGEVLAGRYRIQQALGKYNDSVNTFGPTFLGFDVALGVPVVIKRYRLDIHVGKSDTGSKSAWDDAKKRAAISYREDRRGLLALVRTLARPFKSPAMIGIRDFFEADGTGYVVMDYVEGTTLRELVAKGGGPMPMDRVLEILNPVFDGLTELHQRGLTHGDITPDHVIINKRGKTRLIGFELPRPRRSTTVSLLLKPYDALSENHYLYYDSVTGQAVDPYREPNASQDVYELCATMYACLCGQEPLDVMARVRGRELVPPRRLGVPLKGGYEQVLMRGLELYDDDRYQTIGELRKDLQAAPTMREEHESIRGKAAMTPQNRRVEAVLYVDDFDDVSVMGWDVEANILTAPQHVGEMPPVDVGAHALAHLEQTLMELIGPSERVMVVSRPREFTEHVLLRRNLEQVGIPVRRVVSHVEVVAFEYASAYDPHDAVLLCAIHVGELYVQVGFFAIDNGSVTSLSLCVRKVRESRERRDVIGDMVEKGIRSIDASVAAEKNRRVVRATVDNMKMAEDVRFALGPFARREYVSIGMRGDVMRTAMVLMRDMLTTSHPWRLAAGLWWGVHVRRGDLRLRVLESGVNKPATKAVTIQSEGDDPLYVEFTSPYNDNLYRSLRVPFTKEGVSLENARELDVVVKIAEDDAVVMDVSARGALVQHIVLAELIGSARALETPPGIMELISVLDESDQLLRDLDAANRFSPAGRSLAALQRKLLAELETLGVQYYVCVGLPFDSHLHELHTRKKHATSSGAVIANEIRRGFRYRGRILRRSLVEVADAYA